MEVIEHLTNRTFLPSPLVTEAVTLARQVHENTYSLVLWKDRLTDLRACASPFIDEIASDALQILPQIMLGYTRPTKLLMRGILENTLRFVYFTDHPIEFMLMNSHPKWYVEISKLFDYIKSHPNHQIAEKSFDAINKLQTLYGLLSAGVHGRTVRDLEARTSLTQLSFELKRAKAEARMVVKCVEAVNYILAIENIRFLRRFSDDDKSIILGTLPRSARAAWHNFTGVL